MKEWHKYLQSYCKDKKEIVGIEIGVTKEKSW